MDSKVCVALVAALVGVVLAALASPAAGDTKAAYGVGAARQLMSSSTATKLEDNAAPEMPVAVGPVHRRRLISNIEPAVLNANKQVCFGSCAARGGSYTGRGCSGAYQCRH